MPDEGPLPLSPRKMAQMRTYPSAVDGALGRPATAENAEAVASLLEAAASRVLTDGLNRGWWGERSGREDSVCVRGALGDYRWDAELCVHRSTLPSDLYEVRCTAEHEFALHVGRYPAEWNDYIALDAAEVAQELKLTAEEVRNRAYTHC